MDCLRPLFLFGRVWENSVWNSFFSDISKDVCAKMAFWNLGFLGYVNLWKSIFPHTKDVSSLLFSPAKDVFSSFLFPILWVRSSRTFLPHAFALDGKSMAGRTHTHRGFATLFPLSRFGRCGEGGEGKGRRRSGQCYKLYRVVSKEN